MCITSGECAYSLSYPECDAHPPYCSLWPAPLCNTFPRYLIKSMILEKKKLIEHRICVLISCTTVVWNISHSKKI